MFQQVSVDTLTIDALAVFRPLDQPSRAQRGGYPKLPAYLDRRRDTRSGSGPAPSPSQPGREAPGLFRPLTTTGMHENEEWLEGVPAARC
jgi:hypothetical protein